MQDKSNNSEREHIAYFSMEVGISHLIPSYSGGLGILAGDVLKSFADMRLPVIGITLLNEKGYFYQKIDADGNQIEQPQIWNVSDYLVQMPNEIMVTIEGRQVKIRTWKLMVRGVTGYNIPVYYLDSNIDGNSPYDRTLTSHLYGGDRAYRLAQEIILGIGGVRILESLGYHHIKKYHMNEGHAALLTIELLKKTYRDNGSEEKCYDLEHVKSKCVFTTHTPVTAGHDRFDIDTFKRLVGDTVPKFILDKAIHDNHVNMTLLALNMSMYVNGVAKRHGEVTREMFPEYRIDSITNGVHPLSWVNQPFKELYDTEIPGWAIDPYTLRYALSIPKEKVWDAHAKSKKILIDYVNQRTNLGFQNSRFTIGYARRFTAYKRPDLLFANLERLKQVAQKVGDIQFVFAGKAHPNDGRGKELIKQIIWTARKLNGEDCKIKIAFLEHYDMQLAKMMVSGCDIWLNTPQRPYEASGTSGMKAAMNAVPHFSTLDGWWLEGHIEGVTGWSIGAHPHDPDFNSENSWQRDSEDLYNKLEQAVIPTYYGNPDKWKDIMKHCVAMNASFFNTLRMAQQYAVNAYME